MPVTALGISDGRHTVVITYKDGEEETVSEGDIFYWPPEHTVRIEKDAEVILFSPQAEHCAVIRHLHDQLVVTP